MPMISVQVATPTPSRELAASIAATVSDHTARILRKDPAVTAVAVEFIEPHHWFVGGASCAALGVAAFFVDVRVSDGTNTKEEKSSYVAETFAALRGLLNGAHAESYVHVNDVHADAYGFGGVTQERRFIEAHPLPA